MQILLFLTSFKYSCDGWRNFNVFVTDSNILVTDSNALLTASNVLVTDSNVLVTDSDILVTDGEMSYRAKGSLSHIQI